MRPRRPPRETSTEDTSAMSQANNARKADVTRGREANRVAAAGRQSDVDEGSSWHRRVTEAGPAAASSACTPVHNNRTTARTHTHTHTRHMKHETKRQRQPRGSHRYESVGTQRRPRVGGGRRPQPHHRGRVPSSKTAHRGKAEQSGGGGSDSISRHSTRGRPTAHTRQ